MYTMGVRRQTACLYTSDDVSVLAAQYDAKEGEPELAVEDRVDERVQCRVAVAEPEEDGEDHRMDGEADQRRHEVGGEERQPADDERRHDDAEHNGRSALARARNLALKTRRAAFVGLASARRRRLRAGFRRRRRRRVSVVRAVE